MRDPNAPPIRLLLVEDNPGDARLIQALLAECGGFEITWRTSLAAAKAWLAGSGVDVVLLDLSLPDGTGMASVEAMRAAAPDVPLIVNTGLNDEDVGMAAVKNGCQDYLVKGSCDAQLIGRTIHYAIERKAIERERVQATAQMKKVLLQTVRAVSLTLEIRDPYTAGHQRRVAQLAVAIGEKLGLAGHVIEGLHTGALIHDLGKINVPSDFLTRPGALSAAAFDVVRSHAAIGAEIVDGIDFPWPVAKMIRQHHERIDGTGYPDGLKGDSIITEARILAVADVVEAISSHRPYRPSLGIEAALDEITRFSGAKYDADVVAACVEVIHANGDQVFCDDDPPLPPGL